MDSLERSTQTQSRCPLPDGLDPLRVRDLFACAPGADEECPRRVPHPEVKLRLPGPKALNALNVYPIDVSERVDSP